ncbi:hypothetical protein [Mycolicibacterium chlorophenolicum]|uniref:Uncharacterized protein n=1 Tax=Mycolicibacterium chlorophenolicum TaxID=37916 RepID=A0A0J6YA38_9MYCO|nr:hypothetical protein [Mycolicibacterium chlorophenolicum]KMO69806.1 hypothetical protein MCHLDSM_05918 [Mycolicibacterium chlorophenolicum]
MADTPGLSIQDWIREQLIDDAPLLPPLPVPDTDDLPAEGWMLRQIIAAEVNSEAGRRG